jgi:hypothetical protein
LSERALQSCVVDDAPRGLHTNLFITMHTLPAMRGCGRERKEGRKEGRILTFRHTEGFVTHTR